MRGFTRDAVYVGAWQAATSLADLAQVALVAHLLGLTEYGRLALVTSLVTLVGRFFDVRVGIAATTYGAAALQVGPDRAGPVFRFSYVIDLATGVAAAVVLVPVALLVGPSLIGSGGVALVLLYCLTLLVSTVDESSLAVLRLLDRYRLVAGYTAGIEVVRVLLIGAALLTMDSLTGVVLALVAYKAMGGAANLVAAAIAYRKATGDALLGRDREILTSDTRRQMLRTMFHTNIVTYTKLVQQQVPTIVVGAIAGPFQAGIYKIGTAASVGVARLSDPALVAILPRLSQLWSTGRRERVRLFVWHISRISIPIMLLATLLVVLFRHPILAGLGGDDARGAAGVLVVVAIAWGIDGALFWNASLLFAAGRARAVATVAVITAVVQTCALLPLTLVFEATGAGIAFLISVGLANALNTVLALRTMGTRSPAQQRSGTH